MPQVQSKAFFAKFVRAPMLIGWSGVELFFVLSGFLITGILLDTRDSPRYFRSFYARRALRIFPLYYAVLSVILLAAHFFPYLNKALPIAHDRPFYYVYLNNWWPLLRDTWHGNIIGHFWSLAVEEQFYILWSLCVYFVSRRYILTVTLSGILVALLVRLLLYAESGMTRNITENTFARMDTLLIGAMLALIVRRPDLLARLKLPVFVLGVLSAVGVFTFIYIHQSQVFMSTFGVLLLGFAYGALLLSAYLGSGKDSAFQRLLCSGFLGSVGKYSYGMYVLHVPILFVSSLVVSKIVYYRENLTLSILFTGFVIALTYAAAKASFDLFESRFLRLKKHFRA